MEEENQVLTPEEIKKTLVHLFAHQAGVDSNHIKIVIKKKEIAENNYVEKKAGK